MPTKVSLAFIITACFLQNQLHEGHWENKGAECSEPGLTTETYGYKAVSGDVFVMQCAKPHSAGFCGRLYNISAIPEETNWLRSEGETSSDRKRFIDDVAVKRRGNALWFSNVSTNHSGTYTCWACGSVLRFSLEVLDRGSLGCRHTDPIGNTLILGQGGEIYCPGFNCGNGSALGIRGQDVTWYQQEKPTCQLQYRDLSGMDSQILHLDHVYVNDAKDYFCDFTYRQDNGISWTIRRHVKVSVIAQDTKDPPQMIYPRSNETEVVELGEPYTLECKVQFGFQKNFSPVVEWLVSSHGNPTGVMEHMGQLQVNLSTIEEFMVVRTAHIPEVKLIHLDSTFTCLAQNSLGNRSATIRLKRKPKASLTPAIVFPLVSLLFLASLGITVHIYWLEITILYRVYWPYREISMDEKVFDAFVSYVPSTSPSEEVGGGRVKKEPLEVLLPRVLEGKWGYRLCLLERDLLPGGAYTEDVMWAIHSSRFLVCLMSPEYMASRCLFELETGIRALQNSHLRILLIWTNTGPNPCPPPFPVTSLGTDTTAAEPGPSTPLSLPPGAHAGPMPQVVRRAIRVLPALYWNPRDQGQMVTTSNCGSRFWRSLRKAMPPQGALGGVSGGY